MKAKLSVYNCTVVRVIDGDSFIARGDVSAVIPGGKYWEERVRLYGTDAPERGEEGWAEAATRVTEWLQGKGGYNDAFQPFNMVCYARDKYGRLLADCERGEGMLSEWMIEQGTPRATTQTMRALLP